MRPHPFGVRRAAALAALAVLATTACAPLAPPAAAPAAARVPMPTSVSLRVIAFNDFHGHLEAGSLSLTLPDPAQPGQVLRVPAGGAAALAGLVKVLREQAPGGAAHSVVVASGDQIGATPLVSALFRHESTIEVLNTLGVDVATVGNHEFDAGQAELARVLGGGCAPNGADAAQRSCALHPYTGARWATVVSNVETADGRTLFAPSWILPVGGVRVGFIGAVTRSTPGIVVASGVAGLRFGDEAEAINRAAAALEAQGVRAIVATVHEGGEIGGAQQPADWNDTRCPGFRGDIVDITRRLSPSVDLVLSAHTHQGYRCLVDGRPVLQALSYGRGVSVADLVIDARTGEVERAHGDSRNLPVFNERTPAAQREAIAAGQPGVWANALRAAQPLPAVAQQVAAYAAAAAPSAQRPVGRIGGPFDRKGRTDSAAGRLIADAQLAATRDPARGGAQLALMNPGGVRSDLACAGTPPCEVSYGEAFTMQPFGNSLVVMTLSGAELKALLEAQQGPGRDAPSVMSPSAGLQYRWVARAPAGQRVQALTLDGRPVQPGTDYRVVVNSFMAEGGDGLAGLRRGRDRLGGPQDLDALVAHLKTTPAPVATPRVEWVE
ncbi:bifunctional UDP-sugar hydrolase/5'-nucleotidase [Ideonella sp. A 288]|uniref:bifunctional metallophosphatase/5'-nucleotidase n=1 Tax=Ideonella sp. A 288 TaxID=1962181 RepID=UPI0013035CC0|nr:bifunctional metallophosphatase/5'-nucleotidase [Ideonella sp. A 288]